MVLKYIVVNYNNKYYNDYQGYSKANSTLEKAVVLPGFELNTLKIKLIFSVPFQLVPKA